MVNKPFLYMQDYHSCTCICYKNYYRYHYLTNLLQLSALQIIYRFYYLYLQLNLSVIRMPFLYKKKHHFHNCIHYNNLYQYLYLPIHHQQFDLMVIYRFYYFELDLEYYLFLKQLCLFQYLNKQSIEIK